MIDPDTHCELLTHSIRDRNDTMISVFKSFLATFTAILGGSIAFSASSHPVSQQAVILADIFVLLLGGASALIIRENYLGWWRYRERLTEVAGWDEGTNSGIRPPSKKTSATSPVAMCALILLSSVSFAIWNPLQDAVSYNPAQAAVGTASTQSRAPALPHPVRPPQGH